MIRTWSIFLLFQLFNRQDNLLFQSTKSYKFSQRFAKTPSLHKTSVHICHTRFNRSRNFYYHFTQNSTSQNETMLPRCDWTRKTFCERLTTFSSGYIIILWRSEAILQDTIIKSMKIQVIKQSFLYKSILNTATHVPAEFAPAKIFSKCQFFNDRSSYFTFSCSSENIPYPFQSTVPSIDKWTSYSASSSINIYKIPQVLTYQEDT